MHLCLQKNPLIFQNSRVEEMSHENEYYKRISKRQNPFKKSLRLLIWSPEDKIVKHRLFSFCCMVVISDKEIKECKCKVRQGQANFTLQLCANRDHRHRRAVGTRG